MRVGQGRTIKVLRVLDEIVLADSNTVEAATEFLRRIEDLDSEYGQQLISVYGDASGNSRTTKSSRTDYELIREAFRRRPEFRLEMKANTANPAVKDRVNTVNALLCNASRERNLLISPTCHELIKDLRQVKWKRDGAGNPGRRVLPVITPLCPEVLVARRPSPYLGTADILPTSTQP